MFREDAPDFMESSPQPDPRLDALDRFLSISENVIAETIANRVRMRALLELLEEKGLLAPEEFDERSKIVADRDYAELAGELWEQEESAEEGDKAEED